MKPRFSRSSWYFFPSLCAGLVAFIAGCDTASSGDARVQIQITDAPSDYIQSGEVWISRVYLKCEGAERTDEGEHVFERDTLMDGHRDGEHRDTLNAGQGGDVGDGDSGLLCKRVDLLNDSVAPFHVDLLDLHDGLVANLTVPVDLPAGTYDDLFIVVDSAFVTLKSPHTFSDGSKTAKLRIARDSKKAIKVELKEPLVAGAGATTLVLVDFDVNQSFVVLGNPDTPAGIKGVVFIPTLKERHRHQKD